MSVKSFVFLSAISAIIGLLLVGFAALSVWAVDGGLVQLTTLAYAVPVILIGLAAAAAHYFYRGTKTARISAMALIVASVFAVVAYAAFRWHSQSHRVGSITNKNDAQVTPATNAPATPDNPKNSQRKPQRRKK